MLTLMSSSLLKRSLLHIAQFITKILHCNPELIPFMIMLLLVMKQKLNFIDLLWQLIMKFIELRSMEKLLFGWIVIESQKAKCLRQIWMVVAGLFSAAAGIDGRGQGWKFLPFVL